MGPSGVSGGNCTYSAPTRQVLQTCVSSDVEAATWGKTCGSISVDYVLSKDEDQVFDAKISQALQNWWDWPQTLIYSCYLQ